MEMATRRSTPIASTYYQVRAGGDAAALKGIAKALLQLEEEQGNVLDHAFIAQHTQGFTAFADDLHATRWQDIEQESGLTRESLTQLRRLTPNPGPPSSPTVWASPSITKAPPTCV